MAVTASVQNAARAWLFDTGSGFRFAAGAHHVIEYLLSPETVTIPCTPACAPGVMLWREQMIPWVDFAPRIVGDLDASSDRRRAVVLAWQDAPGEALQYGALSIRAAPIEIFVTDDMACMLPHELAAIGRFSLSSFTFDDKSVLVLDVARLFTQPLPDMSAAMATPIAHSPDSIEPELPASVAAIDLGAFQDTTTATLSIPQDVHFPHAAVSLGMVHAEPATPVLVDVSALAPQDAPVCTETSDVTAMIADISYHETVLPNVVEHVQIGLPETPVRISQTARPNRQDGLQARESSQRRHALGRKPPEYRHRRARSFKILFSVVSVAIVLVTITWLTGKATTPVVVPVTATMTTIVRDIAPAKIEETSAPTTPAQPPN